MLCNNQAFAFQGSGLVSESNSSRKHELECLRLATDCMQLAGDIHNTALQSHFLRMARVWSTLADRGLDVDSETKRRYPD